MPEVVPAAGPATPSPSIEEVIAYAIIHYSDVVDLVCGQKLKVLVKQQSG